MLTFRVYSIVARTSADVRPHGYFDNATAGIVVISYLHLYLWEDS
jgi:hypothetical protein